VSLRPLQGDLDLHCAIQWLASLADARTVGVPDLSFVVVRRVNGPGLTLPLLLRGSASSGRDGSEQSCCLLHGYHLACVGSALSQSAHGEEL
jgi:hypothetical protein